MVIRDAQVNKTYMYLLNYYSDTVSSFLIGFVAEVSMKQRYNESPPKKREKKKKVYGDKELNTISLIFLLCQVFFNSFPHCVCYQ